MPYIDRVNRELYRPEILALVKTVNDESQTPGDKLGPANYIITTFLNKLFSRNRYVSLVYVIGTLFCVALEFYRRRAAPYEDRKISENGDVY